MTNRCGAANMAPISLSRPIRRPRRRYRRLRRGLPEAYDARADDGRVLRDGRAHLEAVVEEIEPERIGAKGDHGVAGVGATLVWPSPTRAASRASSRMIS